MSDEIKTPFGTKFGELSSTKLVPAMKVFDPIKVLEDYEKGLKKGKKEKDNGSKEG